MLLHTSLLFTYNLLFPAQFPISAVSCCYLYEKEYCHKWRKRYTITFNRFVCKLWKTIITILLSKTFNIIKRQRYSDLKNLLISLEKHDLCSRTHIDHQAQMFELSTSPYHTFWQFVRLFIEWPTRFKMAAVQVWIFWSTKPKPSALKSPNLY